MQGFSIYNTLYGSLLELSNCYCISKRFVVFQCVILPVLKE